MQQEIGLAFFLGNSDFMSDAARKVGVFAANDRYLVNVAEGLPASPTGLQTL
jgi:hypothetical protein